MPFCSQALPSRTTISFSTPGLRNGRISVSLATKLYGKNPAFLPFTNTVVPNDALPMRSVTRGGSSTGAFHVVRHQRASVMLSFTAGFISGQCPGTGMVRVNAAGIVSPHASGTASACHVPSSEMVAADTGIAAENEKIAAAITARGNSNFKSSIFVPTPMDFNYL